VDGRLHLSALVLLAPKLTAANVDELVAAASGRSRAGIETLLAERFPQADVPARIEALGPPPALGRLASEPAAGTAAGPGEAGCPGTGPEGSEGAHSSAPARMNDGVDLGAESPASERYSLQLTMRQELHHKLRHAQRLLSHAVRPGDAASVLERALDVLIEKLEKRKCGAASRRGPRRASRSARHVPAHVREAVWERDGGRCTFVSGAGRRCEARERLEYDHVVPVAKGGEATVEGVRLLCRAHNQYEAERTYGAGFMAEKREQARRARQEQREATKRAAEAKRAEAERRRERDRAEAEAKREAARATKAAESDPGTSVIPWLRSLGVQADQARRAAEAVAHMVDAPLEDRVMMALGFHANVRFPSLLHGLGGAAGGAVTAGGGKAGGGIAGAGVVPS
jgi:5-methylcytosine-specific restriction endonuclease McrA